MAKHLNARNFRCSIIRAFTGFIGNVTGNLTGSVTGNITPGSYTVEELEDGTTLPADENENKVVVCSDGDTGDLCLAMSNGTDWLRISLGLAVATP